ncbi:MAG: hypothetical protein H0W07_05410 [Chloroflexi bacterium]|nr:hypothetical protein [Chloroflexota bacterium]
MTASLLDDAMAHHSWATERLIDPCKDLTPEQLATPAPRIDLWSFGQATGRTRSVYL